tara:strand:- start:1566 stop:1955 length:390 start_codon:yes stop_codon:yes gene_type:complete
MPLNNTIQTFIAGGAITEFALVSLDAAGKVQITQIGTDKACVGIAQRAAATGDAVEVVTQGLSRAIAGGNITAATDPRLKSVTGTTGKVETVATGDFAVCRMIPNTNQFTAADGDQILVMFVGPSVVEP